MTVFSKTNALIGLIALISIAVRLPNLDESMWYDEIDYSSNYDILNNRSATTWSDLGQIALNNPSAPVYRYLLFFFEKVSGEGEVALRLPSLIAALAGILVAALLAARWFDKRTALLTGFLLAVSPVHIWYSQEGTTYAVLSLFVLLSVYVFEKTDASSRLYWYLLYFALLLLTVFTQYFAGSILIALSWPALFKPTPVRWKLLGVHIAVVGCFLLMQLAKYFYGTFTSGVEFLRPFTLFEWWMLFFNWFSFGNAVWPIHPYSADLGAVIETHGLLLLQLGVAFLFIRCLLVGIRQKGKTKSLHLAVYLLTPPLILLALSTLGFGNFYIERYLFILLPFFVMGISRGAIEWEARLPRRLFAGALVIVSLIAYVSFVTKPEEWTVYKPNPDWRSAAQVIADTNEEKDNFIYLVDISSLSLVYYLEKKNPDFKSKAVPYDLLTRVKPNTFWAKLVRNRVRTIFFVRNQFWSNEQYDVHHSFKSNKRFHFVKYHNVKGIELAEYQVLSKRTTAAY